MSRTKKERNRLIYKMRVEDGLTYAALGELFRLDRTTVKDICWREHYPQAGIEPVSSSVDPCLKTDIGAGECEK